MLNLTCYSCDAFAIDHATNPNLPVRTKRSAEFDCPTPSEGSVAIIVGRKYKDATGDDGTQRASNDTEMEKKMGVGMR